MNTKRKIKDYKGEDVAIYCSTQEEWDKIINLFPSNKNVKIFHWQDSVNNGKSDTIKIDRYGWSPKKHFENKGYTIYPASDFLEEEKPFKFNIGDEIKTKPGGYYISYPKGFAERHKAKFPSEKSGISGKITERTQAQGFNWYRCGNDNWITEEGIELVKEDIPEYVECIDTGYFISGCSSINEHNLKKGTIYKVSSKKPESYYSKKIVLETEKGHIEIGCNDYQTLYKSSTKEAFDLQNKSKTMNEDVFCIELNSQEELDAVMDFYKQKGFKELGDSHEYFNDYVVFIKMKDKKWQTSVCNDLNYPVKTLSELGIEVKPKSLVGRYLKALVDYPNGGRVLKGEIGIIREEYNGIPSEVDFPSHKYYRIDNIIYKNGKFYELMSEGFKPKEEINTYGLKVGDTLKKEIINAWAYFQGNFCPDVQEGWIDVFCGYSEDRKIEDFRNIDGQIGFHVSECTKGTHYLKAEGFKEFAYNFYKKEMLDNAIKQYPLTPTECYSLNEIIIPQVIKAQKTIQKITIESPTELDLKLKTIKPKQIQTIKI